MQMGSSLSVKELKKCFPIGGQSVEILRSMTFDAPPDRITAIIGPNACGKTTLMRIMAGIIAPDSGQVLIDGDDLYSNIKALRRKVGFVSPAMDFHKKLTMGETLSYFEGIQGSSRSSIKVFLEEMGMIRCMNEKIVGFSEGQKMVLRVGCALMKEPSVILLDEVTSPLDTERTGKMMGFLKNLAETTNIVMIDHNPRVISRIADGFVLMRKNGTVMKSGEMSNFFESTTEMYRLHVRPHESVHPDFWKSFDANYELAEDGTVSFRLKTRNETNKLMDEISKYSGSVHSYEASVVTLADVYEEWIRMAERDGEQDGS
jgi:iron complex transport system ATP-binding protein